MRLFVALDVPATALEHLEHAVAAVRSDDGRLRWVPSDRWHVTLAFLGEVPEGRLAPLVERLTRAAGRHPTMGLAFAGAGRFGSRVLWAGVQGDREQLAGLARAVAAAARRAGVPVDERTLRPHVTLARGRTTSLDLRPFVEALSDYRGPSWQAESFSLVRSQLGPQPRHETVRSWPLAAGTTR
ncbi:MAG TPA: RNA 2',3'-cyclic phosphodiesterase [Actinomycetales bacterium]|nr:RNA 2',3'-cyclic phosphodiesterase [Actinomycetales bacterium]